jgi:type I restriction-modification system DNA methylase subunit
MCADLTTAFEADPFHDYLGESYMELFGECKGKKNTLGQCFTPIEVCECCAEMALVIERLKEEIQERVVTIADEAVGGGAMLIAACKVLHNHGINYQKRVRFYAADLDPACVYMCYVQLSLLGCRAYVKRQNTITMQVFDEFKTPMEMLYPAFLYADSKINIHSMEK